METRIQGAGVPMEVVSEHLGHADTATTQSVYAHVTPEAFADLGLTTNQASGAPNSPCFAA